MHPIERLRYVARAYEVDGNVLVQEAAEALGSIGRNPMALVTSVRRLVEAHPDCGPLFWASAQLLAAENPVAFAHDVVLELATDPTADELAAALPGGATIVVSPSSAIIAACEERPDLTLFFCGARHAQRSLIRSLNTVGNAAELAFDELADALGSVDLVVVEACMISEVGLVLSEHDAFLLDQAASADVPCWVVGGTGRILPRPIFEACVDRLAIGVEEIDDRTADEFDPYDDFYLDWTKSSDAKPRRRLALRPISAVQAVVGPQGPFVPSIQTLRTTCPTPGELCRRK